MEGPQLGEGRPKAEEDGILSRADLAVAQAEMVGVILLCHELESLPLLVHLCAGEYTVFVGRRMLGSL